MTEQGTAGTYRKDSAYVHILTVQGTAWTYSNLGTCVDSSYICTFWPVLPCLVPVDSWLDNVNSV